MAHYEFVVIGSGPAGRRAAIQAQIAIWTAPRG
jgi:thioredoxin reductase